SSSARNRDVGPAGTADLGPTRSGDRPSAAHVQPRTGRDAPLGLEPGAPTAARFCDVGVSGRPDEPSCDSGGRVTGRPPPPWEGALAALVRDRYSALVARAVLLTGSRAEAHDLVHDALVATFTARAQFTSVGHAAAYVRRAMATRH